MLNTYEAFVCLKETEWQPIYPMDYYSYDGGKWSNYFKEVQERNERMKQRKKAKPIIQYEQEDS